MAPTARSRGALSKKIVLNRGKSPTSLTAPFVDVLGEFLTIYSGQLGKGYKWFTPWKINGWNLQIPHLERKMIFQTSMIMFHVNLQGFTLKYHRNTHLFLSKWVSQSELDVVIWSHVKLFQPKVVTQTFELLGGRTVDPSGMSFSIKLLLQQLGVSIFQKIR